MIKEDEEDYLTWKVVLIGESGVGKTINNQKKYK